MVLQRAKAPLVFCYYAIIFVVDCLNHIAKRPLGWRTSSEVLNGDTADISPFRFEFWQHIKFFHKTYFPESRWVMGRFLGTAWDTGDLFIFKVWSEPNSDWRQGCELIHNVARARDESVIPAPDAEEEHDLSQFRFQRMYKTKKRKRGQEFIFDLRDNSDGNEETGDINERSNGEG
jgi:hypothetical protein